MGKLDFGALSKNTPNGFDLFRNSLVGFYLHCRALTTYTYACVCVM